MAGWGRLVIAGLVLGALLTSSAPAGAQSDQETTARELFAVGKYDAALEIYGKLYVSTGHPTYLRNIGRCHQMMGASQKALNSFREYLRRTPNLDARARVEVEGFIREMEALERKRAAPATEGGVEPALITAETAALPAPLSSRSHRGQLGAFFRVDVGVQDPSAVIVPGISYGLGDHLELAGGVLVGFYKGAWLGARGFFLDRAWKPGASLGLPIFFVAGKPAVGVQGGLVLQWDPSRNLGAFVELTGSFFPGVAADLRSMWLVPIVGVQARL